MKNCNKILVPILLCMLAGSGSAAEPYFKPSKANQYVSQTGKYLYVVWAIPRDLSPLKGVVGKEEEHAFLGRTAVYLCAQHAAKAEGKDCLIHVLRMKTNDEYSTSAASGFATVGKLVLPAKDATPQGLERALKMKQGEVGGLFLRFQINDDVLHATDAGKG